MLERRKLKAVYKDGRKYGRSTTLQKRNVRKERRKNPIEEMEQKQGQQVGERDRNEKYVDAFWE